MNRREAHRREEGHFLAKKKKSACEGLGAERISKCWQNLEGLKDGLCVKGKSQASRDWEGLGLLDGLSSKRS